MVYKDPLSLEEFDNLWIVEVEDMLFRSQHAHCKYGDKANYFFSTNIVR